MPQKAQGRIRARHRDGIVHLLLTLGVSGVRVEVDVDKELPRVPHDVGGSPRLRLEEALHCVPRCRSPGSPATGRRWD
ncbi:hypothetical protein GW17_00032618 [Ensete ventricosum]|nr:hypothetical protein GW17_00032618 [Ensete ventricosum]